MIARCNAREKRQRLCSVIFLFLNRLKSANGPEGVIGDVRARWPRLNTLSFKIRPSYLAEIQSPFFALHKCGRSFRRLPVPPARRLPFDGDFGVADRDHPEQQRAAEPADRGPQRHEGKEHQHAAIAFKIGGFEDFDPGQPGADPERGAAQRPQNQTEQASNAIFMDVVSLCRWPKSRDGRGRARRGSMRSFETPGFAGLLRMRSNLSQHLNLMLRAAPLGAASRSMGGKRLADLTY